MILDRFDPLSSIAKEQKRHTSADAGQYGAKSAAV
jgi:hypothetical protein